MENKKIGWILRIALFGEFLGHGIFALQLKQSFLDMIISVLGVSLVSAQKILIIIGAMNIIVALFALIYPFRLMLIWASIWGFATGLARPLSGDPIWDFVERWANIGVPLALLYIKGIPKKLKDWFK
ncbi:hypothetical protein HYT23_06920 [Candidatus Pacearchaeota archaeon]|nr:hypothetical protein [Candidatus Pacearchaeota archaeon]